MTDVPPGPDERTKAALDRLVHLAQLPDSPAVASELAGLLGDMCPLDNQHWSKFARPAVAAYVLGKGGRAAEALLLALGVLGTNANEPLALDVIRQVRADVLKHAMKAVHMRRPDMATRGLTLIRHVLGGSMPLHEEEALQRVIDFTGSVRDRHVEDPAGERRPTVLYAAIWGDRFIDAADRYFFACCAAPGNVPELAAQHGPVTIHLHTRAGDADRIMGLRSVRALAAHATIEITPIPEEFFIPSHMWGLGMWNRAILAAVTYDGLIHARARHADFCQLGADVLLSGNFLPAAKRRLRSGYDVLVTSPIRARTSAILADLEARGCRHDHYFDVDSETLYRSSLEALHPFILKSFMRREPTPIFCDPVFFYFPAPDGFTAHGFQFHCCMFNSLLLPMDQPFDLHTLDGRLLSDLLAGRDPARMCYVHAQPPGDMYHVSLDDTEEVASFEEFELSPVGAVASATKWISRAEDVDFFPWAVQQRVTYRMPPGVRLALPTGCRDEASAVGEMVATFQEARSQLLSHVQSFRQ